MQLRNVFYLAFCSIAAAPSYGQATMTVSAPRVGVYFDSRSHGMRSAWGLTSGYHFAPSTGAALNLDHAAGSPSLAYALGFPADGSAPLVILTSGLTSGDASDGTATPLNGVAQGADLAAFDNQGALALLYSPAAGKVQLISGLPGSPVIAQQFDPTSLPAAPNSWAVSEDGQIVLAAVAGAGVYQLHNNGPASLLASSGQVSSLSFVVTTHDAIVTDAAANTVALLKDAGGANAAAILMTGADGINGPVGAASSRSGRTVAVSNSNGTVLLYSLSASRVSASVICGCAPVELRRLSGGAVFGLTELDANGAGWLVDFDRDTPAAVQMSAPAEK